MKKLIIVVVVLGVLSGGYYWVSKHARVSLSALEGETSKTKRGDLVVPITASGSIQPASITIIKGEASGKVVETPFDEGMMVHKGNLIIRLNESDEQRNVDRAEADHDRARIALDRAIIAQRESEQVAVPRARAQLDQANAREVLTRIDYEQLEKLWKGGERPDTSRMEYESSKAVWEEAKASVAAALAELDRAGIGVDLAKKEVEAARATLITAQKTLEDAKERRSETTLLSPIDGMVLARRVEVGEVVLSGKTSLTGGTILMELADVSNIYAEVNVDEADIGHVRELAPPSARPGPTATQPTTQLATLPAGTIQEGELVEVTVESFPDEKFHGVIERISPKSEVISAIATFRARIRIVSENRDVLVGLLNTHAQARFTVQRVTGAVLVSYDAIQKNPNGEGYGVYVPRQKEGQSKPEPEFVLCEFGVDDGIWVEVRKGLEEGQVVYTKLPVKTRKEEEAEDKEEEVG